MKIAIVDDMHRDCLYLTDILEEYFADTEISPIILIYSSGESFLQKFEQEQFDLVFLDIYMEGISGMEVAKRVYEKNPSVRIIFQTTSDEFGVASYAVHALYYLIKPYSKEELREALSHYDFKQHSVSPTLSVTYNRITVELEYQNIYYVDIEMRKTSIHTKDRCFFSTKTFAEITKVLLEDSRFLICRRGVVVNMDNIDSVGADTFFMKNGESVLIHLRNKVKIKQKYLRYMTERMCRQG